MSLRQDDVQGVLQERCPLQAGAGARPDGERAVEVVGEGEVHGALADERQGVLGLALPDVEHGAGMDGHEPVESGGQQKPAAAGEGGDGELGTAGAEPGDLLLRVFELRGDGFGGAEHDLAGRGEGDAAGAAGDDLGAETALQGGHLLGDGRGGEPESRGRLVEAAVLRHRPQDAEPLYIDQQFSLMPIQ